MTQKELIFDFFFIFLHVFLLWVLFYHGGRPCVPQWVDCVVFLCLLFIYRVIAFVLLVCLSFCLCIKYVLRDKVNYVSLTKCTFFLINKNFSYC